MSAPPAAPAPPMRHALLVGIDEYAHVSGLHGCVNDVTAMRALLEARYGFPAASITTLTNADATRDGILNALERLVAQTGPDDVVVFHYAGHGSQMADREHDEASGMDNTLMPVDSGRDWRTQGGEDWPNRDISDDELHVWFGALAERTAYVSLVVDSCHSGTITRDAFGSRVRSVPADTRAAADLPPSPVDDALRRARAALGQPDWQPPPPNTLAERSLLVAGCRDAEVSNEYRPPDLADRSAHGALTWFLTRALADAAEMPGASWRDVFERAAAQVTAQNPAQHPQMEGMADRAPFGVEDRVPARYVRIAGRAPDGTITLAAGAALGVTPGSQYVVHPPGANPTAEGDHALGEIEVTAVRATSSDARLVRERAPGTVIEGARAVETVHAAGDARLRTWFAPDHNDAQRAAAPAEVAALRAALAASPLVELVDDPARAAVSVALAAPRATAAPHDPAPELGAIRAATWAVVGSAGRVIAPPKSAVAYEAVREHLEKLARYRAALDLENANPTSTLRGKFRLELLRRSPDGAAWVTAEPDATTGQVVYAEDEAIAWRVTSLHDRPVYIALVDFGLSGGVAVLFPPPHAQDVLQPGVQMEQWTTPGEVQTLYFPDVYPYADAPGSDGAAEGVETFKLFVSTAPIDLRALQQTGMRAATGAPAPGLAQLWRAAMRGADAGTTLRETRPRVSYAATEDWTTVTRAFVVRRPGRAVLADALAQTDAAMQTVGTVGTTAMASAPAVAVASRDSGAAVGRAPEVDVVVPDPGHGRGQMLLRTDADGVLSWHFAPEAEPAARGGVRDAGAPAPGLVRRYTIPGPAAADGRGLAGAVAGVVLKTVVFPLVDPLVGAIADDYAERWEARHRPKRVRWFTPDDYASPRATPVDAAGWARLATGRALLFVHGTFSRAHAAFGALPRAFVEALHAQYGGRVFAYDHFTLSEDPRANVDWLLGQIPDGTALDLDVVCHSRGGLVSRVLAERQGDLAFGGRSVRIDKVVFVAAPNAGTALADRAHMNALLDVYTNVLTALPLPGASDVLSTIVTVAKQLAVGATLELPGLKAMRPKGDFDAALNTGARTGETRYFALASDYAPTTPGLKALLVKRLIGSIFASTNDLVVPEAGVWSPNGSGYFPIEQRRVLGAVDGVAHTGFFANAAAREQIATWLGGA